MIEVTDGRTKTMTPSGPLFLKLIINEARMDNTATTVALRQQVINLHATITTLKYEITVFLIHVRRIVAYLVATGETTVDLVNHLLTAFLTVPDASILGYIKRPQDFYEEGNHLTSENLLDGARNKYNALIAKDKWCARTPEEAKIVMLESTIKEFLKHRIIKDIKHKNSENRGNDGGPTHKPQNRGSRGQGRNKQVHRREYAKFQDMPEWFRDPQEPKNPNHTHEWKEKIYHWGFWVLGGP